MKKINDFIVIDADVARSSGETEHPVSSSCRKVLDLVKEKNGKVVFCSDLRSEWRRHASHLAKKWMVNMFAKRRVVDVSSDNYVAIDLEASSLGDRVIDVAGKDSHLVNSAIHASACIASRDDRAKAAFVEASSQLGYLSNVVWFNPVADCDFLESHWNGKEYVDDRFFLKKN